MGREVRRTHKSFDWPLNETWWGYLLDPIPCKSPHGEEGKTTSGEYCTACEGESIVYPRVEPDAYELDKTPFYIDMAGRYGWQMWETVSEGSPISPVCDTPKELAHWLADNDASAFGSDTATYEQWLSTITSKSGSAVSAEFSPSTGLRSGVEAMGDRV